MLNVYGNQVNIKNISLDNTCIIYCIIDKLRSLNEIEGIMIVGSSIEHVADSFSDLDLRIFCKNNYDDLKQKIHSIYIELGAKEDMLSSIHSPFDNFSFQFNDEYIETELWTLSSAQNLIDHVLITKNDDGFIHSLKNGKIIYDKQMILHTFIENIKYPEDLVSYYIKKYQPVSLKLFLHSVHRKDYCNAWYWLWKVFIDETRLLFAKNNAFFPGSKRLLDFYIPKLKKYPLGYINFWNQVFSHKLENLEEIYCQALKYMLEIID